MFWLLLLFWLLACMFNPRYLYNSNYLYIQFSSLLSWAIFNPSNGVLSGCISVIKTEKHPIASNGEKKPDKTKQPNLDVF